MVADPVYVLLADLVTSRDVEDRAALRDRLERALVELAGDGAAWYAPLVPVKGIDELSGVLAQPSCAFDLALRINLAVWPHRFRFALGQGSIDVAYETRRAPAMDGTAFHRGADGLARARSEGLPFVLVAPAVSSASRGSIEALLAFHDHFMRRWTPRAVNAVRAYRRHGSQRGAAGELGVSQQAVSDALRRAHHTLLVRAESAVRDHLAALFPNDDSPLPKMVRP
ncbi:MAG: hypothetical protein CME06_00445 [Gemmatimonadetes bacterium]|nr:hypothetical protein [Gemmatimonadota bacterium]